MEGKPTLRLFSIKVSLTGGTKVRGIRDLCIAHGIVNVSGRACQLADTNCEDSNFEVSLILNFQMIRMQACISTQTRHRRHAYILLLTDQGYYSILSRAG